MALLVAVKGWDTQTWVARLKARFPDRDIRSWPDAIGNPADIRYALTWKAPAKVLAACPNLEVVFSLGAGVDHLLGQAGLPDVPMVRVVDPDLTARMSEWIALQVLLHHRQHLAYAAQQRTRVWRELEQPSARDLRVGVLGLGVLGADAADVLTRLGFKVSGWSRSKKTLEGIDCFAGAAEFDTFLARTDVLVNLLPLTAETRGLVNKSVLEKLARDGVLGGPVFINAGRGGSHVEADLIAALEDGTLKAASLDVFETEPLAEKSPLWACENAIITPHVAADSDPEAISDYVAEQIRRFETDGTLDNRVDPARGY
ncbi:glyoxylate/hydroxypyruvate reductase A [Stappia sp. ES.058]|uniref:2-hydroxyacid dehydrogenase n=1 Tax=Stappia sp. ES.058 TaxID=1881061 RepID=UPI00087AC395|nr:glyoxylate/hydroxypyruvate reductase A [Stappia sp. ES.058]SDT89046.1 glyoxylate/hydroxypyruvate reductase A [Stappia sp. ES.058]